MQTTRCKTKYLPTIIFIVVGVLVCLLFGLQHVSGSFSLFSFISIAGVLSIYLMANMTLVGIILNRKGMRWGYRNAFVMTGLILVLLLGEAMILGTIR